MKLRIVFSIWVLLVVGVTGWCLRVSNSPPPVPATRPTAVASLPDPASGDKDSRAAAEYIASAAKARGFLDESDPAAGDEISQWEQRILAFARNQSVPATDPIQVHTLAVKTAALFRMLKQASDRRTAGKEPYTSQSGFNTMTLVMAMEEEFSDALGVPFSEFLKSLDGDLLKSLI